MEEQQQDGRVEQRRGLARRSRSLGRRRVVSLVTTSRRLEEEREVWAVERRERWLSFRIFGAILTCWLGGLMTTKGIRGA